MIKKAILFSLIAVGTGVHAKRTTQNAPGQKTGSYTVRSGDSLYTIAKKHHTTIEALRRINGMEGDSLIRPGQTLKIPAQTSLSKTPKKSGKKAESPSRSVPSKTRTYRVEAGDTLSGIAYRNGIGVGELRKANALSDDALIRVGQTLKIPGAAPEAGKKRGKVSAADPKKAQPKEKSYRVEAGDTLSGIAYRNGIGVGELRKANALSDNALIRVGQILKIPAKIKTQEAKIRPEEKKAAKKGKSADEKKEGIHIVESGDTLFSIARKYHVSLRDLMKLNGIVPTDVIRPGQELKIPGTGYKRVAATASSGKKSGKKTARKIVYTVKKGDSLWAIAHRNGTTVRELRRLNKMDAKAVIHTGMKLVVKEEGLSGKSVAKRAEGNKRKKAKIYVVKSGDTLWKIARKHKVSIAELRRFNRLKNGDILRKGMKLTVGYEMVPDLKVAKTEQKKKRGAKGEKRTKIARKERKQKEIAGKKKRRRRSALASLDGKGGHYSSRTGNEIIRTAKRYLGRRYVWGAEGPSSFDCSGFTQYVMKKSKGVTLPRVSRKQAYYGKYVSRRNLRPGDLIFFDTSHRRRGYVNHVGIYIGNDKFIHASSARHRVVITSLNSPFYRARFKWGRRVN